MYLDVVHVNVAVWRARSEAGLYRAQPGERWVSWRSFWPNRRIAWPFKQRGALVGEEGRCWVCRLVWPIGRCTDPSRCMPGARSD